MAMRAADMGLVIMSVVRLSLRSARAMQARPHQDVVGAFYLVFMNPGQTSHK